MSFDFNADNYSRLELLSVLELPPTASTTDILNAVNPYILKYTSENNAPFLGFFVKARDILINGTAPPPPIDRTVNLTSQKLDTSESPHKDVTDRVENESGNSFGIPIKQDILNPNLKNVVTRLIHLDSQFRQSTITGSATDYTLDLSDPLKNVLSLRLYSIQIPFTWYIIDAQYNNNVFWVSISEPSVTSILITMPSGNYTPATFVSTLNVVLKAAITHISGSPVSYNESTGKITLTLTTNGQTTIVSVVFFDFEGVLTTASHVNSTLGWLMGYRTASINVVPSGNVADGVIDLYGTKNLLFVLDDYNQNHVNNGLVSITETSSTLRMPSYYRPDLPIEPALPINTYNNDIADYGDSAVKTFRRLPIMIPSAPRLLTQSQIYTVNEIMKAREQTMNYRIRAPTSPDIFAMIPIKRSGAKVGDVYVEFGSSLQTNMRVYFGPVNIERMRIRLLDDKGNLVNLNGMDWSVTLISENLYQY
jgi:hypothetical protein